MLYADDSGRAMRVSNRRILVLATVLFSVLAWPTGAYAQKACDSSAVDQYVECIPTSDGDNAGGGGGGGNSGGGGAGGNAPIAPAVSAQIESQGGGDAALLKQVASSPRYGAPTKKLEPTGAGAAGADRVGKEQIVEASPQADVSAGDTLSAAVSSVQGGDAARLIGLLVALFLVSVAMVGAAAMRQKRRAAG